MVGGVVFLLYLDRVVLVAFIMLSILNVLHLFFFKGVSLDFKKSRLC